MKKFLVFLFVVNAAFTFSGQNKKNQEVTIVDYVVQSGESIRLVAKKNLVDPAEIYRLNRFAVEGITAGMVLKIPVSGKENLPITEQTTIFNPKSDLEIDNYLNKNLTDDAAAHQPANVIDQSFTIIHIVNPQETLYGLSKKYEISIDEITTRNPELKSGLKTGQVVKIFLKRPLRINELALNSEELPSIKPKEQNIITENILHKVLTKETLFGLSKKYKVSAEDIKRQNLALLKNGLQTGQVLTIRKNN